MCVRITQQEQLNVQPDLPLNCHPSILDLPVESCEHLTHLRSLSFKCEWAYQANAIVPVFLVKSSTVPPIGLVTTFPF